MDLFDLSAKITLDSSEYERGLNNAHGKLTGFGAKLKSGLATAAKVSAAAVAAAGAGIAAIAKSAVTAYADYEQLVGGVETLFKDSADIVQEYAANAFKTAGLSANQYMETVTSFSASLLQSLDGDTARAAQVSDMAITDMADNANKMGSSIESIQTAYQGFAKQNYTMLDNLKLGYGGTKTEMERLLADAQELTGVKYDIESLSDVYEAIHVIQTELGITGTTAKEASSTISGSFGQLGSAWQNLLAGFANSEADIGALIQNVVDSGITFIQNLAPVIQKTLKSIGQAVTQLAPIIGEVIPQIFTALLPGLLQAAVGMITAIADALPDLIMILIDQLPTIIPALVMAAVNIVKVLIANLPAILSALWDAIVATAQELWPVLQEAFGGIAGWFSEKFQAAKEAIQEAFQSVGEFFAGVWADIVGVFEDAKNVGKNVVNDILTGIQSVWDKIVSWVSGAWDKVKSFFTIDVSFLGGGKSHAIGLDYVPANNYPALLHRGEAVLTAREADEWRRGEGSGRKVENNFYFSGVAQSDLDYIVAYVNRGLA